MTCPDGLKRRYREGRVIPFIGAGVSMSVHWEKDGELKRGPSWSELVERATQLLGFDSPELARVRGTDLQILEYFKSTNAGHTGKLTNWLSQHMTPPDTAITDAPILSALVSLKRCRLYYTTNYDDFIERAFKLHGRLHQVVAIEAQMSVDGGAAEIIKFHGDLDHPDKIVLTESDYERRLALRSALDRRFMSDLLGRVVLFVGYSFSDPNVSYLFRLFTNDRIDESGSLSGQRAYIILCEPSDFERQLFEARNIEVISVGSHDLEQQIAAVLEEMGAE